MRFALCWLVIGAVLAPNEARGQGSPVPASTQVAPEPDANAWTFDVSAYTYLLPDADNYVQPTFITDRGKLHLEARYNYEGHQAASAWIGYNWSVGETVAFSLTPMLGGVFGDTTGVAPGYKAALGWKQIEFASESEYVFDSGDSADNFFYTWSEVAWAPKEWCRFGMAVQRTKVYQTELDIQRGFLVGVAYKRAHFTTYVFNPDKNATVVLGAGVSF